MTDLRALAERVERGEEPAWESLFEAAASAAIGHAMDFAIRYANLDSAIAVLHAALPNYAWAVDSGGEARVYRADSRHPPHVGRAATPAAALVAATLRALAAERERGE